RVVARVVRARRHLRGQHLPTVVEGWERIAWSGRHGRSRGLRRKQGSGRLAGVVRPPEVPGRRTGPPEGVVVSCAVKQVNPRHAVLDGERKHRPVDAATWELRREDLLE